MAQFKLYLINFIEALNTPRFFAQPISEYNSEKIYGEKDNFVVNKENNFCYTYGETLAIHKNAQKELTFSMDKFITREDGIETNPFINDVTIGTQLLLIDKDGFHHLFNVKKIDFTFKDTNTVYKYTCQDSFTYQLSRQNDGYTIENDSSSEDFIGAKPIDWYANKIIQDCNVIYDYIPLKDGLYLSSNSSNNHFITDRTLAVNPIKTIFKVPIYEEMRGSDGEKENIDYTQFIVFSGSGSASSLLISLGEQFDLMLQVCEYYDFEKERLYRYFWFEPAKSSRISGLKYSPESQIQKFSLSHNGEPLTSILNVSGGEVDDEQITLLPALPPFFSQYIMSDSWTPENCDKIDFSTLYKGRLIQSNGAQDNIILKEVSSSPVLDSDLSPLETNFLDGKVFNYISEDMNVILIPIYENKAALKIDPNFDAFSFYNENKDPSYFIFSDGKTLEAKDYWKLYVLVNNKSGYKMYKFNQYDKIKFHNIISTSSDSFYSFIAIEKDSISSDATVVSYNNSFYYSRAYTEEEEEFALIAGSCPWLENKLIDFNYFKRHNIITGAEYNKLMDIIKRDLRYWNGRLLMSARQYYDALHNKTQILADLEAKIDLLGADFEASVIIPYENNGAISNWNSSNSFSMDYAATFEEHSKKQQLFEYTNTYSDYVNKYIDAEQRFLKNVDKFRNYFEQPVSFVGDNQNYCKVEIKNTADILSGEKYVYSFEGQESNIGIPTSITRGFKDFVSDPKNANYGKPYYPVCRKENNGYSFIEVFDKAAFEANKENIWTDDKETHYLDAQGFQSQEEYYKYDFTLDLNTEINFNEEVGGLEFNGEADPEPIRTWFIKKTDSYTDEEGQPHYIYTITNKYSFYSDNVLENQITFKAIGGTPHTFNFSDFKKVPRQVTPQEIWKNILMRQRYYEDNHTSENNIVKKSPNVDPNKFYVKVKDVYFPINKHVNQPKGYNNNWFTEDDIPTIKDTFCPLIFMPSDTYIYYYNQYYNTSALDSILNMSDAELFTKYKENFPITDIYFKDYEAYLDKARKEKISTSYRYRVPHSQEEVYQLTHLVTPSNALLFYRWNTKNKLDTDCNSWRDVSKKYLWGVNHGYADEGYFEYFAEKTSAEELKRYYDLKYYLAGERLQDREKHFFNYTKHILPTYSNLTSDALNYPISFTFDYKELQLDKNEWCGLDGKSGLRNKYFYKTGFWKPLKLTDIINKDGKYLVLSNEYYITEETEVNPKVTHKGSDQDYDYFPLNYLGITDNQQIKGKYVQDRIYFNEKLYYPLEEYMKPLITNGVNWTDQKMSLQDFFDRTSNVGWGLAQDQDKFLNAGNSVLKDYLIEVDKSEELRLGSTVHSVIMIFQYEDYDTETLDLTKEPEYIANNYALENILYCEDNSSLKLSDINNENITTGLYTINKDVEKIKAEEFDIAGVYYKKTEGSDYNRLYTIDNLMDSTDCFYLNNSSYNKSFFCQSDNTATIDMIVYRRLVEINFATLTTTNLGGLEKGSIKIQVACQEVDGEQTLVIPEIGGVIWTPQSPDKEKEDITSALDIQGTSIIPISSLSNGSFWYNYHNADIETDALLFQNAAIIETNLETYWNAAYVASKYCKWFLPSNWRPQINGQVNPYAKDIWNVTEDSGEIDSIALLNNYLPVTTATANSIKYAFKFKNDMDILQEDLNNESDYDVIGNTYAAQYILDRNEALKDAFNYLVPSSEMSDWKATALYKTNSYSSYYYKVTSGGTTWHDFLVSLIPDGSYSYFGGWYDMMIRSLQKSNYINADVESYEQAKFHHNRIWKEIYRNYPNVILEKNFSDTDATTSTLLYQSAVRAFNDYKDVERSYSITIIDTNHLENYIGQPLKIGMPIEIDAEAYTDDFNEIKDSLIQYLFITDMSYSLRKDSDIALTVNTIKYQDKVIKQLLGLIR